MQHLLKFLLDRIEEDRAAAEMAQRALSDGLGAGDSVRWAWALVGQEGARFADGVPSPQRVIDECVAKMQLIAVAIQRLDGATDGRLSLEDAPELRWLASPYAGHPDYQLAWSP